MFFFWLQFWWTGGTIGEETVLGKSWRAMWYIPLLLILKVVLDYFRGIIHVWYHFTSTRMDIIQQKTDNWQGGGELEPS